MPTKPSKKPARGATPAVGSAKLEKLKQEFLELNDAWIRKTAETWLKQGRILITMRQEFPALGRPKRGEQTWATWVEENLQITTIWASRLIVIGSLPSVPSIQPPEKRYYRDNDSVRESEAGMFIAKDLYAIAQIVTKEKISVDVAAKKYVARINAEVEAAIAAGARQPKRETPAEKEQRKHETKEEREEREKAFEELNERIRAKRAASGGSSTGARPPAKAGMTHEEAFAEIGITGSNIQVTDETLGIIFRGLKQKRHPDKGGTNAAFQRLTKAEEALLPETANAN